MSEEKTNVEEIKKEEIEMENQESKEEAIVQEEQPKEEVVEKQEQVEKKPEEKKEELPQEIKEAMEKAKESVNAEIKPVKPQLFRSGEKKVDIEVDVIFNPEDGDVLSVVVAEAELDIETIKKVLGHQRLKFVFTEPTYDKLNRYRQRSTEFDQSSRMNIINQLRLRDFFIIYHLKEWNLKDEEEKDIEMKFEPNGAMSDETIDVFYALHPTIIDIVLSSFERKVLLSS